MISKKAFKKKTKSILIILTILFQICILAGCTMETEEDVFEKKQLSELSYLDSKIVGMLNALNNISFQNYSINTNVANYDEKIENETSEEEKKTQENTKEQKNQSIKTYEMNEALILDPKEEAIDWVLLKAEIEILSSSWATIKLDLMSKDIEANQLKDFSDLINTITINIKEEDKIETLLNLGVLYSYIPEFYEVCLPQANKIDIVYAKQSLIKAYSIVEKGNWEDIGIEIEWLEINYLKAVQNQEIIEDFKFNIERLGILISELKDSLSLKDKEIFYIKYKNISQEFSVFF